MSDSMTPTLRRPSCLGAGLALLLLLAFVAHAPAAIICAKDPDLFDLYGKVRNATPGICAAVATVNSFVYLWNHYPDVYGGSKLLQDYDDDGDIDPADHTEARDRLAYGWMNAAGVTRNGMYGGGGQGRTNEIWAAKLYWLEDFAPGTTTVDGQVWRFGGTFDGWYKSDPLENKYPEWSFLWDEIKACEDVEFCIWPGTGDAHALTLTNLCFDDLDGDGTWDPGEPRKVHYMDPNGAAVKQTALVNEVGGRLELLEGTYDDWYIYCAYAESPVPEPAAIVVWSLLAVLGVATSRSGAVRRGVYCAGAWRWSGVRRRRGRV